MRVRCVKCKQIDAKLRVLVPGKSSKATYFVNDQKKRWNGRYCPACRAGAILKERILRTQEVIEVTTSKQRPCRKCGKPTLNYFKCEPCKGYYDYEFHDVTEDAHVHIHSLGAGWHW